ncbi:MAG: FkbM family methyltransferase [Acidobacteriota bacterium]|nr:FkbM family methyltransferase [Acidobacteriota bacterium]
MWLANKVPRKLRHGLMMIYSNTRRWHYLRRQQTGEPVEVHLPKGAGFRLYPEGQIAELLYTSRFEWRELAWVSAYLKPGMNVVDIGANIGLYSILADQAIQPGGRVLAFEPSAETHARLLRNLSLNQAASVTPLKLALADARGGHLVLKRDPGFRDGDRYLSAQPAPGSSVADQTGDAGDIETVPITTLDDYLAAEAAAPRKIDFLKMDIEGGEYSVFRGAAKTLTANAGILLMFECTPQGCQRAGHTQDDLYEFLRAMGFELYCWDRSSNRWDTRRELLLAAGNVWACRRNELLPRLS